MQKQPFIDQNNTKSQMPATLENNETSTINKSNVSNTSKKSAIASTSITNKSNGSRLSKKRTVEYLQIPLDDQFPLSYGRHSQGFCSFSQLHFHNLFEIGICTHGSGLFFISNNVYSFKEGSICLILPDQPHIAQSPEEYHSSWIFINLDIVSLLSGEDGFYLHSQFEMSRIQSVFTDESLFNLVRMIIEELDTQEAYYQKNVRSLLKVFAYKLLRSQHVNVVENTIPARDISTFTSESLSYIQSNFAELITISDMAKNCNLSATHFNRAFQKNFKISPHKYLLQIRLKMARALLSNSTLQISEIAFMSGFQSISSFNRTFQRIYCCTPSAYASKIK